MGSTALIYCVTKKPDSGPLTGKPFPTTSQESKASQFKHQDHYNIYIQQDAMLQSLFYLETAPRMSGGTTTHHQERKHLYLQHLVFVTPLLLPAAIM